MPTNPPDWPRSVATKSTAEGLDWRVGSLRVLLLNERGSEGSNARLHGALVAVVDGSDARKFLGRVVLPIEQHHTIAFDLLVVATLDRSEELVERMVALEIERERLVTLR